MHKLLVIDEIQSVQIDLFVDDFAVFLLDLQVDAWGKVPQFNLFQIH